MHDKISPDSIKTDDHFWNFAEYGGLQKACEKETTARVFCLAAQKLGRWDLSQEELDAEDSKGSFHWNGTLEIWFDELENGCFRPNHMFFGRLLSIGLVK